MKRAALITLTLALALAAAARAQPQVSFVPAEIMIQPNQQFDLSFRVGACADSIASFQLYMSFDPSKVQLLQATEGTLYSQSGYMTWFISEQVSPGFWHFFDTVFGAGTHITPPGELLRLRFKALAAGHTQAHVDTVRMTDVRRNALPVEGFEHGEIFVVLATGVEESPVTQILLGPASPNPFAGAVEVPFVAPESGGPLEAAVYDVRGRVVADLVAGASRIGTLVWDGRCADGREAPSAVYFVRIAAGDAEARTRVVKVR
jgi:hypothetical protein